MTAVESLLEIIDDIYFMPAHFWLKTKIPGQSFEELSEQTKEELRKLRSDDLRNVRLDLVSDVVRHCGYRSNWLKNRMK